MPRVWKLRCASARSASAFVSEERLWQSSGDHADAVLHVRLSASESQPATPVGYYRHIATVIDALKKPAASLKTPVFVLQNQRSAAPGPYDIDQELVVFLRSSGSSAFMITNDEPGLAVPTGSSDPAIAFLIQDGRIQRAPSECSRYVGMPRDAFLGELRALPRGRYATRLHAHPTNFCAGVQE